MPIIKRLWPGPKAYQPSLVQVNVSVPIGASGAPGTHVGKGCTVTRTATGRYTLTFDTSSGVGAILYCNAKVVLDAAAGFGINIRTVTASTGIATAQTETLAAPGTAADPTSGATLIIFAVMRNSSADFS